MYIYVIYYDWNKCEIFFFLLELLEVLKIVCYFMYCLFCWIWFVWLVIKGKFCLELILEFKIKIDLIFKMMNFCDLYV